MGSSGSIFTRPAVVWALWIPLGPLDPLGPSLEGLETAVCRLDGMSPLAYVRKIASTPSTLPRYGGEVRNLGVSLRLGLGDCGTGRDMGWLRVDHISRDFLYNPPTYPLGQPDVVSA